MDEKTETKNQKEIKCLGQLQYEAQHSRDAKLFIETEFRYLDLGDITTLMTSSDPVVKQALTLRALLPLEVQEKWPSAIPSTLVLFSFYHQLWKHMGNLPSLWLEALENNGMVFLHLHPHSLTFKFSFDAPNGFDAFQSLVKDAGCKLKYVCDSSQVIQYLGYKLKYVAENSAFKDGWSSKLYQIVT